MKKCLTGFFLVSIILPLLLVNLSAQTPVLQSQVIGSAGMVSQTNSADIELSGILGQFMIETLAPQSGNTYLHQGFWTPTHEVTSVEEEQILAHSVSNYPNPFNNSTTISYTLDAPAYVSIKIYNMSGNVIKELQGETYQNSGPQTVAWNGQDTYGVDVASGSYLYEVHVRPVQMTGARGFDNFIMRNVMVVTR